MTGCDWIKCTERLPPERTMVLYVTDDRRVHFGYLLKDHSEEEFPWIEAPELYFSKLNEEDAPGWYLENVTHWMPLPEPPNE